VALITTNFPQGHVRNRAFGVYSAMAGAGGATGMLLGGVLTTYASWRWVLFVNVPIGVVVAAAAPRVLAESPRRPGKVDVPGAVTGTGGVALLVYGLSRAATGPTACRTGVTRRCRRRWPRPWRCSSRSS
jgi:MFS family permease